MIDQENSFALFACCIPVKGARRSVLCDLQRGAFRLIPNGLYEILTEHSKRSIGEIKLAYDNEFDEEIDSYFDLLVGHNYGFFTNEPECFPELDLSWDSPSRITNAIIDVDHRSNHDYESILRQLDALGCAGLEIRVFSRDAAIDIDKMLRITASGRLRSIDLLLPFDDDLTEAALEHICIENPRISNVYLYSAPRNHSYEIESTGGFVYLSEEKRISQQCCGQAHPGYFTINLPTFSESQQLNSCLNRKISIDSRGHIKNCPSMQSSFGHVRDIALAEVIENEDFTKLWSVNKDQVEVCRDCEFRYICIDCRAFRTDPENLYSKPSKCSYDPYSASWEPESAVEGSSARSVRESLPVLV